MVVVTSGDIEVARWPLRGRRADLLVVDELARLHVAARRFGCDVSLSAVSPDLTGLLDLVGLGDLMLGGTALGVEAVGKPEGGEQAGVEEVVHPGDAIP
jgi:hypothetical protein